jgi:hypothetical protein
MESNKKAANTFLDISVFLTGFNKMELLGTGMLETYFNVVMNMNNVALVESFLAESEKILAKNQGNAEKINNEILHKLMPDSLYNGLAKNIITMWYMGNWMNTVINPQSYVQGLIWGVAETHPPGAKQPGYASWASAPNTVK